MEKTKFKIKGLKCSNCALLIEDRLKNKAGILEIKVSHDSDKGVVVYDEQKITENDIYRAVEGIDGFQLEKIEEESLGIQKSKFRIKGLKCSNCVLLIEGKLKDRPGVIKVKVDQNSNKGVVIYDKQKINEGDIYEAIERSGDFKVEKFEEGVKNSEEADGQDDPDSVNDSEPPKSSVYPKVAAGALLLAIIFITFGSRAQDSNGNQQNLAAVNNAPQQVQQQNQPSAAAKAPIIIAKSDNPVLEAYIVARCPFGLQMQRILYDVVKNTPSLAKNVKIMYMGSVSGNTITAMHGEAEAKENLRQICIREEQPNKYWEYVACQMKAPGTETSCEKSTGVDSAKLSSCTSTPSRGVAYAKKDFDLNAKYQIQGSPTLILNGQQASEFDYGGRTSEAVKTVVCNGFNTQPSECAKKLTTQNAATSFSATY